MPDETASPQQDAPAEPIPAGTIVGGRIRIERSVAVDSFGTLLFARDSKSNKSIALRVLSPSVVENEEQFAAVRSAVKTAAKFKHRNIAATFGVGTYGTHHFVAGEWVEGSTLAGFVQERLKSGETVSMRGAYNVVAHLCKALEKAHETTFHGALRPSSVWITKSGRVKVADFGIGLALVTSDRWTKLEESEQAYLAPEIKAGGEVDKRCDVFGIGALLYVLLTGRSPIEQFVSPSQAHPDATPEIDAILMKCLASDAKDRYETPAEVARALLSLVADTQEPEKNEFGVEMELDVDIAISLAPPAPDKPSDRKAPSPVVMDPLGVAAVAAPTAADEAAKASSEGEVEEADEPQARQSDVDLGNLLKKITDKDAHRWMVVKDKLDHGPFSGRELVQLIVSGEVLADHGLLNMDTGERKKVREFEEFIEFLEQHRIRKSEEEFQEALERTTKAEKRSNVTKFLIAAAAVGVLATVGTGYLITRQALSKEETEQADLAAMFETGQVKITGTAGILKYRRGRGRRSSGGGAAPGGFMSYEQAMNQAVDLGDVSGGGGERQLTSRDVAGVMNRKLNSLFGCVSQELRRGGRLGSVKMDLAIAGSGRVQGVSVNTGSPAFKGCIAGKVKHIRFPSFPAPRMGARYSFNVD